MPQPPDEPLPSLDSLQSRIDALKPAREEPSASSTGLAMQAGVELVAGVGVGCVIGFLIDRWLGTMPVFFLICFALGTAGGWRNLMRRTRHLDEQDAQPEKDTHTP